MAQSCDYFRLSSETKPFYFLCALWCCASWLMSLASSKEPSKSCVHFLYSAVLQKLNIAKVHHTTLVYSQSVPILWIIYRITKAFWKFEAKIFIFAGEILQNIQHVVTPEKISYNSRIMESTWYMLGNYILTCRLFWVHIEGWTECYCSQAMLIDFVLKSATVNCWAEWFEEKIDGTTGLWILPPTAASLPSLSHFSLGWAYSWLLTRTKVAGDELLRKNGRWDNDSLLAAICHVVIWKASPPLL